MGVERRKIICARKLSFSPWCRHVSAVPVLVRPPLGFAALISNPSLLEKRSDTPTLADYPVTFDSY